MPPGLNAASMLKKSFVMIQSIGQSKNLKKGWSRIKQLQVPCIQSLQKIINPSTTTYL